MDLEWGVILTQLGGGLALFLYGMRLMTESLKTVAGSRMKNLLSRLTTNRFSASLAGAMITAVIQSSSVTTVLIVGFISAGLLTLGQSIGVILGANVGTTMTAQIIAFQVYKYGLLMIAVGFFMEILANRERVRQWGSALMGLGLIFFGMELMSIATGPVRSWPPFIDLMQSMQHPLLSVAIGALFTAIVQSSSATTGIVIVLASQGLISLEAGIGLIFGANIGTCVTAIISSVGRPREALQAAWAHVIFNVVGVLLWLAFIPQFAEVVRAISPASESLAGLQQAAADVPRQIANAHTIFNVCNLLIFIWFTGPLARLVERIAPAAATTGIQPKYLDELFLDQPALALDQVRRELLRMGERVKSMIGRSLDAVTTGTDSDAAELTAADDDIDDLYEEVIRFLSKLSQEDLVSPLPQQLNTFVGIANYLENIGDVIEKDMLDILGKRSQGNLVISEATKVEFRALADEVGHAFDQVLDTLRTGHLHQAVDVIESKKTVAELADQARALIAKQLSDPDRLANFQIETDIIETYKRINSVTRRIAKLVIESREYESKADD